MHDDTTTIQDVPETIGFDGLGLAPAVLEAVKKSGYELPSPIQALSIPHLLAGRDLLGIAQTGTGKTAAFALPLLSRIDLKVAKPQVLVLAPTRELAIQVAEAFQRYASQMKGFHVLPIYGGQEYTGQLRQLRRGVHAVVGTPGRIMDHLRKGSLVLDSLKTLVLDEADEMLRMGFIDDVEWILNHTPAERQTALFSATMPRQIQKVAETYLRDPSEVRIKAGTVTVEHTAQHACLVHGHDKLDALTRLLETADFDGMLVFVRTKTATAELAERIEARGFRCDALNGDMSQQARERTVSRFKSGKLDILIATDVAARGIDVPRISHVVNFDIPYDVEAYIHRIGRTGRAGRNGTAITFVTNREERLLRSIERATRSPIEWLAVPGREQVAERRVEVFKQQMLDVLGSDEKLEFFRELTRDFATENDLTTEDAAAALAFLLQRNRPLQPPPDRLPPPRHQRLDQGRDRGSGNQRSRGGAPGSGGAPGRTSRGPGRAADAGRRPSGESQKPRLGQDELEGYRIQVGRSHGATPGHIVGAIANEAGLDSRHIGRIQLHDQYSLVDLPRAMPKNVLRHLQKVRIFQKELAIELDTGRQPTADSSNSTVAAHPEIPDIGGGKPPKRVKKAVAKKPAGKSSGEMAKSALKAAAAKKKKAKPKVKA